jgi:hypothetical protein
MRQTLEPHLSHILANTLGRGDLLLKIDYISLGVFISELFLARPIKIVSTLSLNARNKPVYQHCRSNPGSSTERPLNEHKDITYELEYRRPRKAVSDAVKFCFEKAYECEWTSFDQSKSVARTAKLIETVLGALAETCLEVKKH